MNGGISSFTWIFLTSSLCDRLPSSGDLKSIIWLPSGFESIRTSCSFGICESRNCSSDLVPLKALSSTRYVLSAWLLRLLNIALFLFGFLASFWFLGFYKFFVKSQPADVKFISQDFFFFFSNCKLNLFS